MMLYAMKAVFDGNALIKWSVFRVHSRASAHATHQKYQKNEEINSYLSFSIWESNSRGKLNSFFE